MAHISCTFLQGFVPPISRVSNFALKTPQKKRNTNLLCLSDFRFVRQKGQICQILTRFQNHLDLVKHLRVVFSPFRSEKLDALHVLAVLLKKRLNPRRGPGVRGLASDAGRRNGDRAGEQIARRGCPREKRVEPVDPPECIAFFLESEVGSGVPAIPPRQDDATG